MQAAPNAASSPISFDQSFPVANRRHSGESAPSASLRIDAPTLRTTSADEESRRWACVPVSVRSQQQLNRSYSNRLESRSLQPLRVQSPPPNSQSTDSCSHP